MMSWIDELVRELALRSPDWSDGWIFKFTSKFPGSIMVCIAYPIRKSKFNPSEYYYSDYWKPAGTFRADNFIEPFNKGKYTEFVVLRSDGYVRPLYVRPRTSMYIVIRPVTSADDMGCIMSMYWKSEMEPDKEYPEEMRIESLVEFSKHNIIDFDFERYPPDDMLFEFCRNYEDFYPKAERITPNNVTLSEWFKYAIIDASVILHNRKKIVHRLYASLIYAEIEWEDLYFNKQLSDIYKGTIV